MGTSSDLGHLFRPRKKSPYGFGWGKSRLPRYDIHTEGALPPSSQLHVNELVFRNSCKLLHEGCSLNISSIKEKLNLINFLLIIITCTALSFQIVQCVL